MASTTTAPQSPALLSWTTAEGTTDLTAELADATPSAPSSLAFTEPGTLSLCEGLFPVQLTLGADVTVTGLYGAAATTLISQLSPTVEITTPSTVSIASVSLENGSEQLVCSVEASVSMSDAALTSSSSRGITLTDGCMLDLERTQLEGHSLGVFLSDSSMVLSDSTLQGHSRSAIVAVSSTLTGSGLMLSENNSTSSGAAINLNFSTMVLSDSVIEQNRASFGGAISLNESTISISDSSLIDNHLINTNQRGGAIYVGSLSHLDITDSHLEDNQAGRGGGIYFELDATGSGSGLDFIDNLPDDIDTSVESLTLGEDATFTVE